MERILILLSLFTFSYAHGAVPSANPSLTLSGVGTFSGTVVVPPSSLSGTGVNGIFTIYAGNTAGNQTSGNFYPFYRNGVAYMVTTNKSAYCSGFTASSSTASNQFQLVSANASFAFNASSISGAVYQSGVGGQYFWVGGPTAGVPSPLNGTYTFGNNGPAVFPGIQAGASVSFSVIGTCYEQ